MYLKPKKSLGQNFLVDKNIQKKIINACEFKMTDIVLEIGSGRGELTRLIADKVARVYALEIDPHLCKILGDNLKGNKNVRVITKDILKFNLKRYFGKFKNKIKVIGNIPYYITTPIVEHLLMYRNNIDTVFITVQKEVAKRMMATVGSKEYGSLSCFVQYYTQPKSMFYIKKTCFFPSPKVDSCFLRLKIGKEPSVKVDNKELFFKIIRAAFNKRRKTLRNSLKDTFSSEKLAIFFEKYSIDINARPEALSLEDFAKLANI